MRYAHLLLLAAILLAALALRVVAIDFGRPSHVSRPDEELVLMEALFLTSGDPHVHFHRYPPGLARIEAAWLEGAAALGLVPAGGLAGYARDPLPFHVAGRFLAALLGVATVLLVYLLARRAFTRAAGLVAAAVLACAPLHVMHSHFATLDAPGTFFLMLSVAASWEWYLRKGGAPWLIGAGLAAGVAAAVKYPHGVALLVALAFIVGRPGRARNAVLLVLPFCAGLLALAPELLLSTGEVLAGVRAESAVQAIHTGTVPAWDRFLYHARTSLGAGFGWGPLALAFFGILVAGRMRRAALVLLLPCLTLLVVHCLFGAGYMRYMLPLLPFLAVFAGGSAVLVRGAVRTTGLVMVTAGCLALPVWSSIELDAALLRPDTRGELRDAFRDGRLPADLTVFLPGFPFKAPFPIAWNPDELTWYVDNLTPTACEQRRRICAAVLSDLDSNPAADQMRLKVFRFHRNLLDLWQGELGPPDALFVVPEHYTSAYRWCAELRDALLAFADAHEVRVVLLLTIEPNAGRPLPDEAAWQAEDFGWWTPFPDPLVVEKPGPRFDVYRVTMVRHRETEPDPLRVVPEER